MLDQELKPLLLTFPGRAPFAAALAQYLDLEQVPVEVHRFPDGESLVRVDTRLAGRDCILFCSMRDPDEVLFPLLSMAATARELGARSVGLLAPYLAYMRQDRRFHSGEAVSARPFADLLSSHFDYLVTVDPHLHRYNRLDALYRIPSTVVSAAPMMAQWVRRRVHRPLLIGPDEESLQWVGSVAEMAGAPFLVLNKVRHDERDVEIRMPEHLDVGHHTPVLIDDILSTGNTLEKTVRGLSEQGSPPPVCMAIHAVFAGDAQQLLLDAGASQLVTTNSIEHSTNWIDLSAAVAAALRKHLRP